MIVPRTDARPCLEEKTNYIFVVRKKHTDMQRCSASLISIIWELIYLTERRSRHVPSSSPSSYH